MGTKESRRKLSVEKKEREREHQRKKKVVGKFF
jgi:hypothetical protein